MFSGGTTAGQAWQLLRYQMSVECICYIQELCLHLKNITVKLTTICDRKLGGRDHLGHTRVTEMDSKLKHREMLCEFVDWIPLTR